MLRISREAMNLVSPSPLPPQAYFPCKTLFLIPLFSVECNYFGFLREYFLGIVWLPGESRKNVEENGISSKVCVIVVFGTQLRGGFCTPLLRRVYSSVFSIPFLCSYFLSIQTEHRDLEDFFLRNIAPLFCVTIQRLHLYLSSDCGADVEVEVFQEYGIQDLQSFKEPISLYFNY